MTARGSTNSVFDDALAAVGRVEQVESAGRVAELVVGNGWVITQYITEHIVQAQEEVLFSTCFWADSPSLSTLHDALVTLNNRARDENRRVTVKVMFSFSFRQTFLSIKEVRKWKPNTWEKLGLPNPAMLDCLDLTVFSRFRKPFGVMHAKFVVIDRAIVLLPSKSLSHLTLGENWYELAIRLEGDIVQHFRHYFFHYFYPTGGEVPPYTISPYPIETLLKFREQYGRSMYSLRSHTIPIAFLSCGPSRRGLLPFAPIRAIPALFQIEAIARARRTIFIQTPGLTSLAIIKALKQALLKTIKVTIYLPRNMMVIESLVTGWSTTKCRVRLLQKWARRHQETNLAVEWFQSDSTQEFVVDRDKTHIKFMVIDEELVIVGSSNLDRASACTSGEVNVAFSDPQLAEEILSAIKKHQLTGSTRI